MTCEMCGNSGRGYDPIVTLEGKTLCSPCAAGRLYAQADDPANRSTRRGLIRLADTIALSIKR